MFAGCYHGHSDGLLAAGGSGMATLGLPASAGVPAAAVSETVVLPYNTVPTLDDQVACVIVEPVAANMGLVPPAPGFLAELRRACSAAGALLIFDEVITGFRIARGGAVEFTGVRPDVWTFGKVIGGGLPLAAFAGRRDVMEQLAPIGPVYQAGTLSGNPLATAAGLAVLDLLDDAAYTMLAGRAAELGPMLSAVVNEVTPAHVPVVGPLVGLFFATAPVTNYAQAKAAAETGWYPRFFRAMLERGVAFAPGAYEAMFPSLAHTWSDIERTVDLARAAIAVA
jgi:glutamate-1-semialdehyde 2,1-aminomutase